MTKKDDELAALKARVEELERAAKPPEPFKPQPFQRYDPTANFSVPRSVVEEMARAVPDHVMKNIAMRDARAPTGPSSAGVVPSSQQVRGTGGGRGSGWSEPTPLSNPPGVNWADRLMDHQDAKDRAELIEREAKLKAMAKLAEGKP